jgi:hypothetical protein
LDDPLQGISAMSDIEPSDLNDNGVPVTEARPPRVSTATPMPYTEARIASMEAHVDHMRDDLGDMRRDYRETTKAIVAGGNDVRALDDRVSNLPGKGWMFLSMLLFTVIICAVMIYLEQIRDYLGVLPPSSAP